MGVLRLTATVAAAAIGSLLVLGVVLLSLVPRTGWYSTFIVLSPSMEPAIAPGSIVVVLPVSPSSVRTGDVITFTSVLPPHPSLSHRVQAVFEQDEGVFFKTKGDANVTVDPWDVKYDGPAGKVVLSLPFIGYLMAYAMAEPARIGLGMLLAGLLVSVLLNAVWGARLPAVARLAMSLMSLRTR